MKNINKLIAYICVEIVAFIIGIPAYITGEIDMVINMTAIATMATLIYIDYIIKTENEYYED